MTKPSFWKGLGRDLTIALNTGASIALLYLALTAMSHVDGRVTADFNSVGEGRIEVVSLIIIVLAGIWLTIRTVGSKVEGD